MEGLRAQHNIIMTEKIKMEIKTVEFLEMALFFGKIKVNGWSEFKSQDKEMGGGNEQF